MKLFACQHCNHLVYFENVTCAKCGYALGYLPDLEDMSAVLPDGPYWLALAAPQRRFRFCQNWELRACNWLVDATLGQELCMACRHNQIVPDVSDPLRLQQWVKIEDAKRRLIYSLLKFGLPLLAAGDGSRESLVFQFLAEMPDRKKIMTGHENGLITIALKEADDSEREKLRNKIGETYRTLIGHFRHEVGHYYWDLLVRDSERRAAEAKAAEAHAKHQLEADVKAAQVKRERGAKRERDRGVRRPDAKPPVQFTPRSTVRDFADDFWNKVRDGSP